MARTERSWNHDFQSYMEDIVKHPNYKGLPIERKRDGSLVWVAFAESEIGQARKIWIEDKAREFGWDIKPGVYAAVMREIHPTKIHVCQICGSRMSIYYHYPNANFLKALKKNFELDFSDCDHIGDVWEQIIDSGVSENDLRLFFKKKFALSDIDGKGKDEIIAMCEYLCRTGKKKALGPGAMANPPDRYDGFHTYSRCHRAEQDKGRSKENLKSYTKDRRAYEYWSDGNLHAANMFMGSGFFDGVSADHIGPISLGFVHDPRYLRPMTSGDNSTKRDRLLVADVEAIIEVEKKTGVYPMSWFSSVIWEFIKANYEQYDTIVATYFRDMLKQSMTNFMFVLKAIVDRTGEIGETFLFDEFIAPKTEDFEHAYSFKADGSFTTTPRHRTERSANEFERFKRIAFTAVDDYSEKSNRHVSADLSPLELIALDGLCDDLIKGLLPSHCRNKLNSILKDSQNKLINNTKILYMS